MKTFVLFLACTLFLYSAQAQISKGSILVGGSLGYANTNSETGSNEFRTNSYSFRPSLGFVIKENRALGFNLLYAHSGGNATAGYNVYGGGVFYRLYHPLGKSFYLYGEGEVNGSYSKQGDIRQNSIGLSASPGIAYSLSKRFHLEMSLNDMFNVGYTSSRTVSDRTIGPPPTKSSALNFGVNANPVSNLSLGFRIVLGK
jgi:hypothetical protein